MDGGPEGSAIAAHITGGPLTRPLAPNVMLSSSFCACQLVQKASRVTGKVTIAAAGYAKV